MFVIKFMEIWHFGADLRKDFSAEDIPNIRIQIVNDLLMSEHNKADRGVVTNFHGQVSIFVLFYLLLVSQLDRNVFDVFLIFDFFVGLTLHTSGSSPQSCRLAFLTQITHCIFVTKKYRCLVIS